MHIAPKIGHDFEEPFVLRRVDGSGTGHILFVGHRYHSMPIGADGGRLCEWHGIRETNLLFLELRSELRDLFVATDRFRILFLLPRAHACTAQHGTARHTRHGTARHARTHARHARTGYRSYGCVVCFVGGYPTSLPIEGSCFGRCVT